MINRTNHVNSKLSNKPDSYVASQVPKLINDIISSRFFLIFSFIWFIIQSTLIAVSTRFGVPPDEAYHYEFIQLFTKSGWSPFLENQIGYNSLGEAVETPFFMYHYLLSIPNHFFGDGDLSILMLRLVNILLGLCSLILIYKIAKLLKMSSYFVNISIFMAANTIMFIFISASVSYDNLFILVSLFSIFLILKILQNPTVLNILLFTLLILVGVHIKNTFLVVALILVSLLMFRVHKTIKPKLGLQVLSNFSKNLRPLHILLIFLIAMMSIIFIQRYVSNVITYGSFEPSCAKVLSIEECRENGVFARNERLDNMERPPASINGYQYVSDWIVLMNERTYGVFAHIEYKINSFLLFIIQSSLLVGMLIIFKKFNRKYIYANFLLFVSLAYIGILMLDNYSRYERYGSFTFAVQGRYALPFLLLLYLVSAFYVGKLKFKKNLREYIGAIVIIAFFLASVPSFILNTDQTWRNEEFIRKKTELISKLPYE